MGLRKYDHIFAGLRSLRWLNVEQKLVVNDAVIMHKCVKGLSPSYFSDKFSTRADVHDRQTRLRIASIFHFVESMLADMLFYFLDVKIWNNLRDV